LTTSQTRLMWGTLKKRGRLEDPGFRANWGKVYIKFHHKSFFCRKGRHGKKFQRKRDRRGGPSQTELLFIR